MIQVVIFSLEKLESRYTGQWMTTFPESIIKFCAEKSIDIQLINLEGETLNNETTTGAFLNFSSTNFYKNTQFNKFLKLLNEGTVKKGCKLIFPDAWNPCIIEAAYLNDLLDLDFELHSLFHAGSYDPQDFLGRLVKNKKWSYAAEKSFFHASIKNYFATNFHRDLFIKEIFKDKNWFKLYKKAPVVGFPFDYLPDTLSAYKGMQKRDLILFPHRIAPEKQLYIFKELEKLMPEYEFVVCQEKKLTKHEYHSLLGEAKIVFSANKQETLGISMYEGALVDAFPVVPNWLSYKEMYDTKYPSEWVSSEENFNKYKKDLVNYIKNIMSTYELSIKSLNIDKISSFFNSTKMLNEIFSVS